MSDNQVNLTRRTILSAAGAGAAMAFLAACGSSSDNANTTPSAAATTPANDPTTAAPSPTATASASATKTSAPAAPAADAVIALDKVPVGGSVAASVDGQPVIVSQPTKGKVACFSAICTHQGATVNPDGEESSARATGRRSTPSPVRW